MVVVAVALLAGCSKEIDENKPIGQVKMEASKMKPAAVQKMIGCYEPLIAEKAARIEGIKKQVKDLSISELMGEKAKTLHVELRDLTASLGALQKQMAVYAEELESASK